MTYRLITALALIGLSGCQGPWRGTQIGVENMLLCQEVSSEVLTDLDAVPEGFSQSPREVIDALSGSFSGVRLEEEELPTEDEVSLSVADGGGSVTLIRYEPSDDEVAAEHCPPVYNADLDFSLTSDTLPALQVSLTARLTADGEGYAQVSNPTFDESLPEPTTFDPDDFDVVDSEVSFSGSAGSWWAYVSWVAMNPDESEPDADYPQTTELLLMAMMEQE